MKNVFKVTKSSKIELNGKLYELEKNDVIEVISGFRKTFSRLSNIADQIEQFDKQDWSDAERDALNEFVNRILDKYDPTRKRSVRDIILSMPESEAENFLTELSSRFPLDSSKEISSITKPKLKLLGTDGDAFAILARACRVAEKNNMDWETIHREATSGDYDHLLNVIMEYFDVE